MLVISRAMTETIRFLQALRELYVSKTIFPSPFSSVIYVGPITRHCTYHAGHSVACVLVLTSSYATAHP
jgi:hypothetical protein